VFLPFRLLPLLRKAPQLPQPLLLPLRWKKPLLLLSVVQTLLLLQPLPLQPNRLPPLLPPKLPQPLLKLLPLPQKNLSQNLPLS